MPCRAWLMQRFCLYSTALPNAPTCPLTFTMAGRFRVRLHRLIEDGHRTEARAPPRSAVCASVTGSRIEHAQVLELRPGAAPLGGPAVKDDLVEYLLAPPGGFFGPELRLGGHAQRRHLGHQVIQQRLHRHLGRLQLLGEHRLNRAGLNLSQAQAMVLTE